MAKTIIIDPVTRVEGHMRIDITVADGAVTAARSAGTSFRGFEPVLVGRDPREAPQLAQRICGVCPVPHGRCACEAIEAMAKITISDQALLIRNLLSAANFLDSHLAHFYIMALPDYIAGIPTAGNWPPKAAAKAWRGGERLDVGAICQHAVTSLDIRKKCHQITSLLGGKSPHPITVVPGGVTTSLRSDQVELLHSLWASIQSFVDREYADDLTAVSSAFPEYADLGATGMDMLSYGGFRKLDWEMLFRSGIAPAAGGQLAALDSSKILESVAYSSYQEAKPLHPLSSDAVPVIGRIGASKEAYSWVKAPRIDGKACEVGPLARAIVSLRYAGVERGVWARHRARRDEASLLCLHALAWARLLQAGQNGLPSFPDAPVSGTGAGLHEAPRGALGHWIAVEEGKILRYSVISPTTWNGSPRDEQDQPGPIEAALVGTPIADTRDPIEAVRVVHSFDPCLQCAVH